MLPGCKYGGGCGFDLDTAGSADFFFREIICHGNSRFRADIAKGSEIRSSQSDAMKTWPASPLSMARSVSFSPTTKADAFNSSNVMNLPLLLLSNFTQHWNYIITVMQCQQNDGAFLLYSCRTLLQRSRAYHLCVYPFLSEKE